LILNLIHDENYIKIVLGQTQKVL